MATQLVRITVGSGNWTPPTGVYGGTFNMCGAGGGGGSGGILTTGGGGGGSGEQMLNVPFTCVPGVPMPYVVGAKGTGAVGGVAGPDGGASTFSGYTTAGGKSVGAATGGAGGGRSGGAGGVTANANSKGVAGPFLFPYATEGSGGGGADGITTNGRGSGGDSCGQQGGDAGTFAAGVNVGGAGGASSFWGRGANGPTGTASGSKTNGNNASSTSYGAGGSGGTGAFNTGTFTNGGDGADGVLDIYYEDQT